MESNDLQYESEIKLTLDAAQKHQIMLYEQGRYQEALDFSLQVVRTYPKCADVWNRAAANCIHIQRWQDAIDYAQTALSCSGSKLIPLYNILAHAHGMLEQWDEARRYGLLVLDMLANHSAGKLVIPPPEPGPLPPLPSAQTRERNVIAFSLFGRDPKYCETAVLNVQDQPGVYPYWICRFYVDGSVPEQVVARIRAGGGQVVLVDGSAAQWPGPMWRLLALDDPQMHRILFRDADSLISPREAAAVEQWLASGKRFHVMRDDGGHTELMLAGLWGVVGGSLPSLGKLMERFMSVPLTSRHFADQDFLRQYIWPYARASLMQHDSVFDFMDAVPFPNKKTPDILAVGRMATSPFLISKINLPNGSEIIWDLYQIIEKFNNNRIRAKLVCSYPGAVKDGTVKAHIPLRYRQWIEQGTAHIAVRANSAA